MPAIQRIGNVFYRAPDLNSAVHLYRDVLGFTLKFRDGDRWAAFDGGGVTLAVEGGPADRGATVSLRVEGLAEVVERLRAAGATVGDIQRGEHEQRADLIDPAGNQLILYEPA